MNMDSTIIQLLTDFHGPAIFFGSVLFGETVIIAAAFLAAEGLWPLGSVFGLALAGTIASDSLWFVFGRQIPLFFNRWEKQKTRQEKLLSAMETLTGKRPLPLLLCTKFIYGTRILTIMYLSMRKLALPSFILCDAISSTAWLMVICSIGWLAGKSIANLAPFLNTFGYAALVVILIIATLKIGTLWIGRKISQE